MSACAKYVGLGLLGLCLFAMPGHLNAGSWTETSPQGTDSASAPTYTSGDSPITYRTSTGSGAWQVSGMGGGCWSNAWVLLRTYGTWTGAYNYSTPSTNASFNGSRRMTHSGSPAHAGIQGKFRGSWTVRVTFEAECSATSIATAKCGGATLASGSLPGEPTGWVSIDLINVGCTTSGNFPIGFTVGGSFLGTGLTLGIHSFTNSTSTYISGLQFRQYTANTPEMDTSFPEVTLFYNGSTSAKSDGTATPGWISASDADANMTTTAEVSKITLDVVCPPPQG